MKKIEQIAIFLICLIISLPIYSAYVYAEMNVYAQNSNGVVGYRRSSGDSTIIIANISESGVSPDKVLLKGTTQKTASFNSCIPDGDRSICKYAFSTSSWSGAKRDFFVQYSTEPLKMASITVDNIVPNVTIDTINSGSNLEVKYSVKERAFDNKDATSCSAIKRVLFKLAGQTIQTTELNMTPGTNCDYSTTVSLNTPSTNKLAKTFCVEVFDNVENMGYDCKQIVVDKEPAQASALEIYDSQDRMIEWVSSVTPVVSAKLRFNLDEQNIASIYADASQFNVQEFYKQQMSRINVDCSPKTCNGKCICSVPITLSLPTGGNPSLKLFVVDNSGISSNLTLPIELKADNTAPKVVSLVGAQCGGANAIGPYNNKITATIEEAGSGFNSRKLYLDLSQVMENPDAYRSVVPNDCTKTGNNWICTWGLFNAKGNTPTNPLIQLSPSQDDAGNYVQTIDNKFVYDNSAPIFIDSKIIAASRGELSRDLSKYPTSGGTIQLTVLVRDSLPVTANADFSDIARLRSKNTSCTNNGQNQTCIFNEIGPLKRGPLEGKIKVNLVDCVGNSQLIEIPLNISNVVSDVQDMWQYDVGESSPSYIDRQTLSVFSHRSFHNIYLTGHSFAQPIVQEIVSCDGEEGYLDSNLQGKKLPDLLGAPSKNIYAKFNIKRAVNPPDQINYTCIFRTISRTNDGIIHPPEYDNVTFKIIFKNSAFDTIDEALQNKVDDVKNGWLVQGKLIALLKQAFDIAQNLCNIWTAVQRVVDVLSSVGMLLYGVAAVFPPVLPTAQAYDKGVVAPSSQIAYSGIGQVAGATCSFISCKWVLAQPVQDSLEVFFTLGLKELVDDAKTATKGLVDVNTGFNPKDSLVLSTVTLCIPGIIYNLQKGRQIECSYISCVEDYVEEGVPPYYCDVQRATAWCSFVFGEIWSLFPWAKLIEGFSGLVKTYLTDPLFLTTKVISATCAYWPAGTSFCVNITNFIAKAANLFSLTEGDYWKGLWQNKPDLCEKYAKTI